MTNIWVQLEMKNALSRSSTEAIPFSRSDLIFTSRIQWEATSPAKEQLHESEEVKHDCSAPLTS